MVTERENGERGTGNGERGTDNEYRERVRVTGEWK